MRAAPILLVPIFVPKGTPSDTAEAMGAGAAISGADPDGKEGSSAEGVTVQLASSCVDSVLVE